MRVLFFGSGAFGLPTLKHLGRAHDLVGIVSQPDRPAGRGGKLTPTPISDWAATQAPAVPLMRPASVNGADVVRQLQGCNADAWVVIAFGQKLSQVLLGERFAVNLHASLLPRWRGAAPINAAILAGDAETGNSVITLADRMDAGMILAQSRRPIGLDQTTGDLHDLLASDGPGLVGQVLSERASGALNSRTQDEGSVTVAPKLGRQDGWVDFGEPAEQCRRRINGLSPWPGVTAAFRGAPLKLVRATISATKGGGPASEQQEGPGCVTDAASGFVACRDGSTLQLLEVQPPGKRVMSWKEFANGHRVSTDDSLVGGRAAC